MHSSSVQASSAPDPEPGQHRLPSRQLDHVVQFYEHDDFLIETVATFVADGLRVGQPAMVVITAAHRAALERRLEEMGGDGVPLSASGNLLMLDAEQTLAQFVIDGQLDGVLFADRVEALLAATIASSPSGHIRVYGEMVNVLWRAGDVDGALGLEELWNQLGTRHSFSLLCGYGMDNFRCQHDAARFEAVCHSHTRALPTESYLTLQDSDSRLREVSALQQRAYALENEIAQRRAVESERQQALRVRDDFLAVASHELRTPLTVMRLQLTALLARPSDDRAPARLSLVAAQTERLVRMADRLLDVAQLREKVVLRPRPADLATLVRDGLAALGAVAAAGGCAVTVEGEGAVPGHWDPDRLEQAIEELLANAFKFGGGAPVRVAVHARPTHAELTITDGGIGIAAADQAAIFERGARSAPIERFGGLGLGLWRVRRIVEAHGGAVTVESTVGQGARFTVSLPYAVPAAVDAD